MRCEKRKTQNVVLPVLSLFGLLWTPSWAQQAETLSLDQALRIALAENRTIKSARIESRKLDAQTAALRTRRLPALSFSVLGAQQLTSLDFLFAKGSLGTVPGVGPLPANDTTIRSPRRMTGLFMGEVAQPLSPLFKIKLNLEQLRLGADLTKEQQRARQQTVANEVKRLYYGILQTGSSLRAVEESLKLYRELDRITAEYVAQQTALKGQSLEIKARLARAEYTTLTLRQLQETQNEQLNGLLGRDIRTAFRVDPLTEFDGVDIDLQAARKMALEQRPELKQARLKTRQAEQDRRIKKAEYIPDVALSVRWIAPVNYSNLIPSNIGTAGVSASWEPFDWGRKKHELAQKDGAIEQAALAEKEAETQIAIDVGNRHRKLAEARQLLALARTTQDAAQENLRVETNRYKEQSSLYKDVLQAQVSLADANNQYEQALQGFWMARADFEKALGTDQ
jgi:outer membrane protein TolC